MRLDPPVDGPRDVSEAGLHPRAAPLPLREFNAALYYGSYLQQGTAAKTAKYSEVLSGISDH